MTTPTDTQRLDWLEATTKEAAMIRLMPCGDDLRFLQVWRYGDVENFPTVEGGARGAIDAAMRADGWTSPVVDVTAVAVDMDDANGQGFDE